MLPIAAESYQIAVGRRRKSDVASLSDLMSLPASDRNPLPDLAPQRRSERTFVVSIRQARQIVGIAGPDLPPRIPAVLERARNRLGGHDRIALVARVRRRQGGP